MRLSLVPSLLFLSLIPACGDCIDLPDGPAGQIFCLPPSDDNDDNGTDTSDDPTMSPDDPSGGNTVELCMVVSEAPDTFLDSVCADHPWEQPSCEDPLPPCEDILEALSGCPEINTCDYTACADALAVTPCGEPRPMECQAVVDCYNSL